jgi:hypothetical protein
MTTTTLATAAVAIVDALADNDHRARLGDALDAYRTARGLKAGDRVTVPTDTVRASRSAWGARIYGEVVVGARGGITVRAFYDGSEWAVPAGRLDEVEVRADLLIAEAEELAPIAIADLDAGTDAPVVLVPCGAAKLDHRAPAGELYVGSLHRSARRAADRYAAELGATVLILSAAHGLVALDAELDPYDVTIGDAGAITAEELAAQAAELGITRAVVLGSAGYVALARSAGIDVEAPLAGSPGLFAMRGRLRALAVGELPLAA